MQSADHGSRHQQVPAGAQRQRRWDVGVAAYKLADKLGVLPDVENQNCRALRAQRDGARGRRHVNACDGALAVEGPHTAQAIASGRLDCRHDANLIEKGGI